MYTFEDYLKAANRLGTEPEVVETVVIKEIGSNKGTYKSRGVVKSKILYERHVFWRCLEKFGENPNHIIRNDSKNREILSQAPFTKYGSFNKQWDRLNKAKSIHEEAALMSASYSPFQILGENYKEAGYDDVFSFVEDMLKEDKELQINAFVNFIENNNLTKYLKDRDFESFARYYNGPNYWKKGYHIELSRIYQRVLAKSLPKHESKIKAVLSSNTMKKGVAPVGAGTVGVAPLGIGYINEIQEGIESFKKTVSETNDSIATLSSQADSLSSSLSFLPWAVGGQSLVLVALLGYVGFRYLKDRGYLDNVT